MPPDGEIRRQLEHDLDRVARRQALVGVAAERPGHGQLALRHLDVGADRELGRLSRARRHGLGPPDRRADEALAVGVGGILFVEHHFLRRRRRCGDRAGCRRGRCLLGAGLDPVGDLRPRVGGRRVARGLDRRARGRSDRARPCSATATAASAADRDDDDGNDGSLDQIAIRAARPRLFVRFLLVFQLVIDRRRRRAPFLGEAECGVVERERRLQHRLGEILRVGRVRAAPARSNMRSCGACGSNMRGSARSNCGAVVGAVCAPRSIGVPGTPAPASRIGARVRIGSARADAPPESLASDDDVAVLEAGVDSGGARRRAAQRCVLTSAQASAQPTKALAERSRLGTVGGDGNGSRSARDSRGATCASIRRAGGGRIDVAPRRRGPTPRRRPGSAAAPPIDGHQRSSAARSSGIWPRRRLARCLDELPRRFGLDLADRFLERQALAGDVRTR